MATTVDISEEISKELLRLDGEIRKDEVALKEKKDARDNLKKSWEIIQRVVVNRASRFQPVAASKQQQIPLNDDEDDDDEDADADASDLNANEQRIVNAITDIGHFDTSRTIAKRAGMDAKVITRITQRMRKKRILVAHPYADPNSKFHFPLGIPSFLDDNSNVKPDHEYPFRLMLSKTRQ
jgi:hypothetical protein